MRAWPRSAGGVAHHRCCRARSSRRHCPRRPSLLTAGDPGAWLPGDVAGAHYQPLLGGARLPSCAAASGALYRRHGPAKGRKAQSAQYRACCKCSSEAGDVQAYLRGALSHSVWHALLCIRRRATFPGALRNAGKRRADRSHHLFLQVATVQQPAASRDSRHMSDALALVRHRACVVEPACGMSTVAAVQGG